MHSLVGSLSTCPLRIACLTSSPAMVQHALRHDVKPGVGFATRFTALWSCATMFFSYFEWRMTIAVV